MNSRLDNLPQPLNPVEIPTPEEIKTVERQVENLPVDYKLFIKHFGSGTINNFIWILNPASSDLHLNLIRGGEPILSALRELRQAGESCPYLIYLEVEGLFPFGKSDNGDTLFWLRVSEPNRWTVVVNAARDPEYQKFDCGMSEFVAGTLTHRLQCSIFPKSFPTRPASFTVK